MSLLFHVEMCQERKHSDSSVYLCATQSVQFVTIKVEFLVRVDFSFFNTDVVITSY